MSISSANPDDLNAFTTQAGAATTTLRGQINQLIAAYQAFKSSEASVNAGSVAHTLQTFVDQNATDEKFVATVRQAFIDADSHTVLDSTISAQLSRAGVSQSVPGVPTIDDPTLNGMPLNSGMSDDPVCMATGHFVEVEVDLAMPPSIGTLSWERTYNSRFVVDGPLGRGWSSWAGVALVERSDGTVEYRGPDGQLALWIAHGDAFLDNAGVPAIVRRVAEGLDLSWSWSSRHPGATWSFAPDGRLLTLRQPGCGVVVASYEDGHMVRLAHEGGRSLLLSWSYERLVAVTASDGRHVRYRYDGHDLVGADRPSGAMAYDSDDHGRIVTVTDADGIQAVRNEYDEDGRVLLQQSPFGRTTRFEYLGRMTVLAGDDQGGPVTLFRHDLVGRLVEMVTAEGTRLERSYDAGGHLVREVDLAGGETRRRFDVAGNLVGELLPGGRERSFTYDRAGRLESSTDEVGTTARYRYDGDARLPSGVDGPLGWSLRYRVEGGMVAGVEDADGVTWDFELDADGQVVAVTDALGGRTALERHPTGEVNAIVLPGGERQVVRRDEAGRMVDVVSATGDAWRSEWSRAGRLTAIVAPDGGRTDCAWGANGTLEAVTDPLGGRRSLRYDVFGNLIAARQADGAEWQFGYDRLCRPVTATDPTGATWSQRWDAEGRWLGIDDPTGFGARRLLDEAGRLVGVDVPGVGRHRMGYDAAGRLIHFEADGVTVTVERDALGRPVRSTDTTGQVEEVAYTPAGRVRSYTIGSLSWTFDYDAAGRLVTVINPSGERATTAYDGNGRVAATRSATGASAAYHWDADGRLEEADTGTGPVRYRYQAGRVAAIETGDGAMVRLAYDRAGRVASVNDALGGQTHVRRDGAGQVTGLVDAKGAAWQWELDLMGRPVATVDPLGRRQTVALDPAGRPVARDDGNGRVLTLVRDGAGRMTAVREGDEVLWALDGSATGRRRAVAGPDDRPVLQDHDDRGRLVRRDVGGRVTTWSYDDVRARLEVTTPDGDRLVVVRDQRGRVSRVAHDVMGVLELAYDGDGRLRSVMGPGVRREWEYRGGLLIGFRDRGDGEETEVVLQRDPAGRVIAETVEGVTRTFGYDGAGQLTGEEGPRGSWRWSYDSCGRMVAEVGPGGDRRFSYDAADQLVAVASPAGTITYAWDDAGRRVGEKHPDGEVTYDWDRLGRLIAVHDGRLAGDGSMRLEVDALGELAAAGGIAVDWSAAGPGGGGPLAVGGRTVIAAAGSPIAFAGPAGTEAIRSGWRGDVGAPMAGPWGPPPSDTHPRLGFVGEIELGSLVWLRNRTYDTATHAFLSRDPLSGPLGAPGGMTNPYTYATNDPLQFADPLGLKPMSMDQLNSMRADARKGCWETVAKWVAVGALVVGGVALIAMSGGALAAPLAILAGDAAAPVLMGAGIGAVGGVGGTAFDEAIHGQPIDPGALALGGTEGLATGALSAGAAPAVAKALLPAAAGAGTQVLGSMAAGSVINGLATGGSSVLNQEIFNGRVDPSTSLWATGTGMFSGVVPGASPGGDPVFGAMTRSQAGVFNGVLGGSAATPASILAAGTDTATPPPTPPAPDLTRPTQIAVAHLQPAAAYGG